jgi:hypothetical protein
MQKVFRAQVGPSCREGLLCLLAPQSFRVLTGVKRLILLGKRDLHGRH